jgi:hypothetical protein
LSGYFTVLAALLLAIFAPYAHAAAACNVVYTISPQNTSQFGAAITIQNTGTTNLSSWTLTWTFANGQTVAQLWNGIETQSGANVTVNNEPYNGSIAAGTSLTGIGFNGTWNGTTNAVPASFAVNGVTCGAPLTPTTTTLTASTTTPAVGASVTLTATVAPTAATGTVTFYSGTTSLGTGTLSAGKATLTTSFATAGTYSLTAVYAGSTTYATSTSSAVSITVGTVKTATTTVLTASTTTPAVGASVTLTATVAPTAATGTVTFYSGTTSLGTGTLSAGKATLTTSFATAGTYSLTAVYAGSTTYATSTSSAVSITVGTVKTATTTVLTASTTTPAVGASVTLTATVTPTAATGTVTFYSGTTSLGTGTLSSGKATLTTSFATAGTYSLTAVYAGSTTYATSTSSAVSITVGTTLTATTTALAVSTTTPAVGASVTLTATVTPTAATGTVTFYSGTTSLGTGTLSTGKATLTTSFATAGSYSLTAVYGGSTTYATSTSSAVSITVGTSTGYAATAKANFLAMYGDMTAANGYFSPLGIPYHSVETFMVEAPDYGHETVSETYSYYLWLTSMYGAIDGNWAPLTTAWDNMQTYMIPSAAQQPTNAGYNPSAPATYCPTYDSPSSYPCQFTTATVGIDPLSAELTSAYGTPNIYAMHWILDTTNWYGYGIDESGPGTAGAPSFYNSYQRGPMESVWLTIPQPSWDIFKYGNTSDGGYLSLFTGGSYTQQWKYTDAPDADARSIQALYWAQRWSGNNSSVAALLPLASKLGDYLRYSFYDKYFKEQGCQSTSCPVENGTKNSSAYLLSWYYAWGGAVPADGSWAWRIGSSDVHFGYQNPVAAYALSTDTSLIPKGSTAKTDWTTALQRTLEFYRWLQSSQGAIAGGATNSWGGGSNTANPPTAWGGQYAVPPAGTPTFYGMSYIFAPSYENPPSNQWFGMQAWSMERLAEYYYISGNADAKIILDPWIAWVEANSTVSATAWSIPSTIGWSGQPALNWNASTQNWTPGTAFNAGLNVSIVNSGEDVGVTGSLCKALLYYSAGTAKYGTQDMTSFNLAKSLLQTMWTVGRDSIGVSTPETRTDYSQLNIPVYVPSGWTGTMPNGDPINSSSTFLSIRTQYETDPNYAKVAAYAAGTGPAPVFNYHRFWAQTDVATAYGAYFLLFPND